jgi:hypothetical protein
MIGSFTKATISFGCLMIANSCAVRNFGAEVQATIPNESTIWIQQNKVSAVPFNVFRKWLTGSKEFGIYDYPEGFFSATAEKTKADGVFYEVPETYWKNKGTTKEIFLGSTTEGVTVKDDVLTYPVKDGRSLALKFWFGDKSKQHSFYSAYQICKGMGLRLPVIQESLDYCASGFPKDSKGSYSKDNRCPYSFWLATVNPDYRYHAWHFNGRGAWVGATDRHDERLKLVCVGAP